MSWWAYVWLCVVTAMISSWVLGPPISYGGLLLWYIYDMFPVEKPSWLISYLQEWFVKHPKEQYVTLHGSVLNKAIIDIVENVREQGWTDEEVLEAVKGLFVTAYNAGGTIDDIDHMAELLGAPQAAPEGIIRH